MRTRIERVARRIQQTRAIGAKHKHAAIRAAVVGGWVNVLVTDTDTADTLLS